MLCLLESPLARLAKAIGSGGEASPSLSQNRTVKIDWGDLESEDEISPTSNFCPQQGGENARLDPSASIDRYFARTHRERSRIAAAAVVLREGSPAVGPESLPAFPEMRLLSLFREWAFDARAGPRN